MNNIDDSDFEKSLSWRRNTRINDIDIYDILSLKTLSYTSRKSWIEMLHGLEYTLLVKNKILKIIWLIFIIISVLISIYLTVITINEFFENKTITLNTIRRSDRMLYHGITICPKFSDTFNYFNVKKKLLDIRNNLDNKTVNDLIIYTIAGGGFDNYNNLIKNFDNNRLNELDNILKDIISYFGNLKNLYKYIFEEENFKCEDFFDECTSGDETLDCCKLFKPTFVLIRGRCYKLKQFYQTAPDEQDKLKLTLKALPSAFLDKNEFQEQLVIYSSPRSENVSLFPRYYIYARDWNRFRFTKQMYKIHYSNSNCNPDKNYEGLAICYVNEWIRQKIYDRFNCTLFYIHNKKVKLPICSPKIIVENYDEVMTNIHGKVNCNQACIREEVKATLTTRPYSYTLAGIKNVLTSRIHIEMSYGKLQEYIYQDVLITRVTRFISELGGHTGLFVGFTVVTIVQVFFILFRYIVKEFSKMKLENVNGIKV